MKTLSKIGKAFIIGTMVLSASLLAGCTQNYSQSEVEALVSAAKESAATEAKNGLYTQAQVDAAVQEGKAGLLTDAEAQEKYAEEEEAFVATHTSLWTEDYDLCENVAETLNENDVSLLSEGSVSFDGESYDYHDEFVIGTGTVLGVKSSDSDQDDVYQLQLEEESLKYTYVFEEAVPAGDISEDESLMINFLGTELELIEADSNTLKVRSGEKQEYEEFAEFTVEGHTVAVIALNDDEATFQIDGKKIASIDEGDSEDFDGFEIAVDRVIDQEAGEVGNDRVLLYAGKDVVQEIGLGDSAELFGEPKDESDAAWIWSFDVSGGELNSISLVYNQEHQDFDEDFKPLLVGEYLSLAGLEFGYASADEVDTIKYTFKVDDLTIDVRANAEDGFRVNGQDYDRVFVNATGVYDSEEDEFLASSVALGESGLTLDNTFFFGGVNLTTDYINLLTLKVDGVDVSTEDQDVLTCDGLRVDDAENNFEDNKVVVSIPQDDIEAKLEIRKKIVE